MSKDTNMEELREASVEFALKASHLLNKGNFFDKNKIPQEGAKLVDEFMALIAAKTTEARIDEHEIIMRTWAKPGVGDIKFTDWSHHRRKALNDLAQLQALSEEDEK